MGSKEFITTDTLKAVLNAFNRHDVDEIMQFFAVDATFDAPRGPDMWGTRFEGAAAVRDGLKLRFSGIPDVHYSDDRHAVSGDRGFSEWLLTGTTTTGEYLKVRGCDLWEFRDGKITRKDSHWKIVTE